jgi:biopolymer transport protein ExbB
MMLHANIVVVTFVKGGWVMWPILATFFLALCVILDRAVWWVRHRDGQRRSHRETACDALSVGDFQTAWKLVKNTPDPYLENLREGILHAHTSMQAAMQLHATQVVGKSEAGMWAIGTFITLAPLLGLFGTVIGLMGSFEAIGSEDLAVAKVTGGIGEALIATACGIAIAVLCLLPYNFFRKRIAKLRWALQRWMCQTDLLVRMAKEHGHDLEDFANRLTDR